MQAPLWTVFFIGNTYMWTPSYIPKAKLLLQEILLFHLNKDSNVAFLPKPPIPRSRKNKNYLPVLSVQEEQPMRIPTTWCTNLFLYNSLISWDSSIKA